MTKDKWANGPQNTTHKLNNWATRTPLKHWGELSWPYYISGTRRLTHVKSTMISYERRTKTGNMTTTTEHVRGHPWHKYFVTVSQVMMVIVKHFWNDDFNLINANPMFSSFFLNSKHKLILRKSCKEQQAQGYCINWIKKYDDSFYPSPPPFLTYLPKAKIYAPYSGAAEILLYIDGKFTIGKWKPSLLSYKFDLKLSS